MHGRVTPSVLVEACNCSYTHKTWHKIACQINAKFYHVTFLTFVQPAPCIPHKTIKFSQENITRLSLPRILSKEMRRNKKPSRYGGFGRHCAKCSDCPRTTSHLAFPATSLTSLGCGDTYMFLVLCMPPEYNGLNSIIRMVPLNSIRWSLETRFCETARH